MKKSNYLTLNPSFDFLLLKWNKERNRRQMPWKAEKDPYKIWLSEIILQQTRVEQGLSYYNSFVKNFPDIHKLAEAPDEKVFKLWEGLGYYTRCKNLISTARYISKEHKGVFPSSYEEILALKGIGPYTAAAISSFAFNLPHAVVDGNVFRVLARIFGINKAIDTTNGKKFFAGLATQLLNRQQPGLYNQAIMDFGAIVCKPVAPLCAECIFNNHCKAYLNNKINILPVKKKKLSIKKRWFNYLVIECESEIAIRKRMEKDIWQQLFEFPMVETPKELNKKKLQFFLEQNGFKSNDYKILSTSPVIRQQLSHQLILAQFINIKLKRKLRLKNDWRWIKKSKFGNYAFPRIINKYLEQKV